MMGVLSKLLNSLDPKEQKGWKAFVGEHKNCKQYISGNGISVELFGDTIGGYVILMKCKCGAKENITNFDNW